MVKKHDFVKKVAENAGLSQKDTRIFIDAMQDAVFEFLAQKEEVKIFDGVTLGVRHRDARNGFNPKTQERIVIPEGYTLRCKFGSKARALLA